MPFVAGSHLLHPGAQRRGAPETLPELGRILEGGSAFHPETHGEFTHYRHTCDLHYFPIPQWRSARVFIKFIEKPSHLLSRRILLLPVFWGFEFPLVDAVSAFAVFLFFYFRISKCESVNIC